MRNLPRALAVLPVLLAVLLAAVPSPALEPLDTDQLHTTLTQLLATHPAAKRTTLALKVVDFETGEVLFDRNSDKLLTPASNLKIYTSAAALDLLGPDYRWETRVGYGLGDPEGRRRYLVLLPGADPMLDTDDLRSIAERVAKEAPEEAVSGVVGGVLSNPRWRDVPLKGPGWMWDDDPDYYNMSITDVMLDFNLLKVTVSPAPEGPKVNTALYGDRDEVEKFSAPRVRVEKNPEGEYPQVRFGVGNLAGRDGYTIEAPEHPLVVTRKPFHDDVIIRGNLAPDADAEEVELTVHDPRQWVASVFSQMLTEVGVKLSSRGDQPETLCGFQESFIGKPAIVVTYQGKTLAEAVRHFLKVSENAVGEMLLLKLAETFGEDGEVSWPSGAKVISDWLVNEAGLEEGSFRLVDGSGLSRYNLISADSSVRLLTFMKTHEHFEPFFDGLPIYKVKLPEGEKFGGVPIAEFDPERVFAKTGGMSGVSTISGYVQTLDGRWLVFSFLGNGFIGSAAPVRDLRNQIWAELVRYEPAEVGAVPE